MLTRFFYIEKCLRSVIQEFQKEVDDRWQELLDLEEMSNTK